MPYEFPDDYGKPILLDIFDAAATGWAARCAGGASPDQTQIFCARGSGGHLNGPADNGFLTPEQLQQRI